MPTPHEHEQIRRLMLEATDGWGDVPFDMLPSHIRPVGKGKDPNLTRDIFRVPTWGGRAAEEPHPWKPGAIIYHGTHRLGGLRERGPESGYYWEINGRPVEELCFASQAKACFGVGVGGVYHVGSLLGPWVRDYRSVYVSHDEWEAVPGARLHLLPAEYALGKLGIADRPDFFYWEWRVECLGVPPRCRKPRKVGLGWWTIATPESEVVQGCAGCGAKPGVNNVSGNHWDCYNWYKDDKGRPVCSHCAAGGDYNRARELLESLRSEEAALVRARGWDRPPQGYPSLPEKWRAV